MSVEVRVLGEVQLWIDDRSVNAGHARQRCVLALLALDASRLMPVEQLIDRVWGDRTPGDARGVLYTYLARLRRILAGAGDVSIQRRPGGYVLTIDPLAVDLHQFRHLYGQARTTDDDRALGLFTQALDLWRGEAFASLDTEWLDTIRTALAAERLAAELAHTELRLRRGDHVQLLPEVAARAKAHPFDEHATAHLMLALYRAGRSADALGHYLEFRQRLAAELGTDPGPDLQQLHQQILTNDPALTTTPDPTRTTAPAITAAVPAAVVVPRQLPATPAPFTGRAGELARLSDVATPGTAVLIAAISGTGGIGKTWLALRWAHSHADQYPDGQLFVDLRGFSPDSAPMDPTVAVRGFLDALGVRPDCMPVDPSTREALYRSVMAGRKMLIVLDNAATTDQVVPLLPGDDTSTVLVTSRRTLSGLLIRHGAHDLSLDILTEPDAHALLARSVGKARIVADPTATTELIRLCGGFPLALGIVAARAHTHPAVPLADLAAELADLGLAALADEDPAASLPTVLSWSFRMLSPPAATLFGLLGITPGPDIGWQAAAFLAGLPEIQTRVVLRELEHASLVAQQVPGRYRMHDLIRPLRERYRPRAFRARAGHGAAAGGRLLYPHRAHRQPRAGSPPPPDPVRSARYRCAACPAAGYPSGADLVPQRVPRPSGRSTQRRSPRLVLHRVAYGLGPGHIPLPAGPPTRADHRVAGRAGGRRPSARPHPAPPRAPDHR